MKRFSFTAAVVLLAVAVAIPTFAASRGSRFVPMGEEPLSQFPLSQALGISSDGEVALVCLGFIGCGAAIWREGAEGQFGTSYTVIEGISGGLPAIADNYEVLLSPGSLVDTAGVWDGVPFPDAGYDPIVPTPPGFGLCGSSGQSVYDFSGNARYATGLTWIDRDGDGSFCDPGSASAFRWDRATGITTVMDNSVNDDSTRGNALNADGSVIVGWGQTNQREAMKWVNGVQSFICPNALGAGGDVFCSEGWDVSDDGQSILTSYAGPGEFSTSAAVIGPGGTVTKMDPPPFPGDPQFDTWNARALRGDGGAVVGSYGGSGFFGSPPYPVLWQQDIGTVDLQVMLLGQGLDDLFFWFLSGANAISDDGKKIVGYGTNPNGWVEAWLIDISKVKVCHKPDGNQRTIAIDWDSVGDHLAHGDVLSTCEFAEADGRSRAAERLLRGQRRTVDATSHPAMITGDRLRRLESVGGNSYSAGTSLQWNPNDRSPEGIRITPAEREERLRQLAERVRKGVR